MPGPRDWLFVIDLQPGFSDPASPWFSPALAPAAANIARLVPAFGDRVLFSRFVPPAEVTGAWQAYYQRWGFARDPANAWMWEVDAPWRDYPSMASHTLSKWVPEATRHFDPTGEVVICGVSTDCCVLGTALAAVDSGQHVRVVADACAATPELHAASLAILKMRAPILRLTTTAEELG